MADNHNSKLPYPVANPSTIPDAPPPYDATQPPFVAYQPPPGVNSNLGHHPTTVYMQPQSIHYTTAAGSQATVYAAIVGPGVGIDPAPITCPSCAANVVTMTKSRNNARTHLAAACLCLFICWPCAWIPYVMDSCKSIDHTCPSCGTYIGTYNA